MNRSELPNRVADFWRDFISENHWRFPEMPPSDLLGSLHCDISDVDHSELIRAKWMWSRRPGSLMGDGLLGYLIVTLIGLAFLLIPSTGFLLALFWFSVMALLMSKEVVSLVRWRHQYESSIVRAVRSRTKFS